MHSCNMYASTSMHVPEPETEHVSYERLNTSIIDELDPEMRYHRSYSLTANAQNTGIVSLRGLLTHKTNYGVKHRYIFRAFGSLISGVDDLISQVFIHGDVNLTNITYDIEHKCMWFANFRSDMYYSDIIVRHVGNEQPLASP